MIVMIIVYSFEENYDVPNKNADNKLRIPTNNYFSSSQYHRNKTTGLYHRITALCVDACDNVKEFGHFSCLYCLV